LAKVTCFFAESSFTGWAAATKDRANTKSPIEHTSLSIVVLLPLKVQVWSGCPGRYLYKYLINLIPQTAVLPLAQYRIGVSPRTSIKARAAVIEAS
jgi:hypothetical protein